MSRNLLEVLKNTAKVLKGRAANDDDPLSVAERAQLTLDSIGDAVITINLAGNITYLNPVAESMTGWSQKEAAGRSLPEVLLIIDSQSREPALNPLALAMLQNKTVGLSANCVMIRRDGHESAIEDTAAPIRDRGGRVIGAVIVFHDVGVARALSLRMSYLAQHDFLTKLPNRMLFNDRLTQAISAAHRNAKSLAVLFMDVDRFKGVNDSLGHAVGDQLLQSIARRLVAGVRNSDTVSRYGGDEFVILLSEVAHARDVVISARKVVAALDPPHRFADRDLHVTVSVGISVYPGDGTDADTLLRNADMALIRAKSRGLGKYQFFRGNLREPVCLPEFLMP
jgi:diguanylate cyclase (GGDEF)-like protein/PAS domain S-box-containing protein